MKYILLFITFFFVGCAFDFEKFNGTNANNTNNVNNATFWNNEGWQPINKPFNNDKDKKVVQ